jgi:hypothetical protein
MLTKKTLLFREVKWRPNNWSPFPLGVDLLDDQQGLVFLPSPHGHGSERDRVQYFRSPEEEGIQWDDESAVFSWPDAKLYGSIYGRGFVYMETVTWYDHLRYNDFQRIRVPIFHSLSHSLGLHSKCLSFRSWVVLLFDPTISFSWRFHGANPPVVSLGNSQSVGTLVIMNNQFESSLRSSGWIVR